MPEKKYENALIEESSPYLLQHAHNPVNWYPWNDHSLELARQENKMMLISVGYAACHWCHVMERESFEDEEVAVLMNANFINIKVDREERPDIDQIYMDAIQLMTGAGGWPMNVIALPDGRPIWGGTYFRKQDWKSYLKQIAALYKESPGKIEEYASNLSAGVKGLHEIAEKSNKAFSKLHLNKALEEWSAYFDPKYGGPTRTPKFMMPVNFEFFLRFATVTNDNDLLSYVNTTLTKMAYGGIYDALGGGFSRYSVDAIWHVPHFEKMLYDNAQLVSLYANAFKITKNELYKQVIEETLKFVERELMAADFSFYASLDADSTNEEGVSEEGAFYIWTEKELKKLLKDDYPLFKEFFNINDYGHWENGKYVLIRNETETEIAERFKIDQGTLRNTITHCKKILFEHRKKRQRPGLDDKIITSWNAMMLKGYTDAFKATSHDHYLNIALKNGQFIESHLLDDEGRLFRTHKNGKSAINGFLEDYTHCAEAFISLYESSFDEKWLLIAQKLVGYVIKHFYDPSKEIFYFTSDEDRQIVTRSVEKNDNVIPASNSVIQKVLFKLSRFFNDNTYYSIAEAMMNRMLDEVLAYPYSHANWLHNYMNFLFPFSEVVIAGKDYKKYGKDLNLHYLPNVITSGSNNLQTKIPLLQGRLPTDNTQIFVCTNNTCELPVKTISEAIEKLF